MNSITIITIVVVALLTVVIFGLAWLGYTSCLRMYKLEVEQGKHDKAIFQEYHGKKKKKKASGIIGLICSYTLLAALLALFVTGIVYKASGENFSINNQTALVIKSGSMSGFYDEDLAMQYQEYNYDTTLQFDVGDICIFDKTSDEAELVEGEVYGYRYRNIIITHRLIKIHENGMYEFRGDNNPASDGALILRNNIIYHYTGNKVPVIGVFVLYAQSYFGIWSVIGIIGVAVSSEIVYYKLNKINKERDRVLGVGMFNEKDKK